MSDTTGDSPLSGRVASQTSERQLAVAYVLMSFPVASETFAESDIQALLDQEHRVEVHELRPRLASLRAARLQQLSRGWVRLFSANILTWLSGLLTFLMVPHYLRGGLSLLRLKNRDWREFIGKCILLPQACYVARRISASDADVVHLFWGHFPSLVGILIHGKPVTLFLGAYDLEKRYNVSREMAKRSAGIITHARCNESVLRDWLGGEPKINVIHRGIPAWIIQEETQLGCKRPWHIVCASRLIPEKRIDSVLLVVHAIHRAGFDVQLEVYGAGPALADLRRQAIVLGLEDRVCFVGHCTRDDVVAAFRRSRWAILLSESTGERLPNSLKEAMASGCIVVTNRTPGIEELVTHGVTGLVFDRSSVNDVAAAMIALSHDPDASAVMAEKAIDVVRRDFVDEVSMRRYLEIWRSVIPGVHNCE